jgi:hypothetical protein
MDIGSFRSAPTVILNDATVRRDDNNDPLSHIIAPPTHKKTAPPFFSSCSLALPSFTQTKSAIMADGDEEIAALVIDNGSGMCKGMFITTPLFSMDRSHSSN